MKISVAKLGGNSRAGVRAVKKLAEFLSCLPTLQRSSCLNPLAWTCVILADNTETIRVNRQLFDSDNSTDVISLKYAPAPGSKTGFGEIVVNVDRAIEEGPYRGGMDRELALYIAHGLDHLSGENDDTAAGYARMRRRELRWLKEAEKTGLLRGLIR